MNRRHAIRSPLWVVGIIGGVVVLVAALVAISLTLGRFHNTTAQSKGTGTTGVPVTVLKAVNSVRSEVLAQVGIPVGLGSPMKVSGRPPELLGPDGKPEVLYIGAEYCPFCAAERWALVVALSHFGSFNGLRATHSSSIDEFPDTQTFSFYGSSYSSPDLDFVPVEIATNEVVGDSYGKLQRISPAEQALLTQYDQAPYASQAGAIPFIDIANRYISVGAGYSSSLLAGLTLNEIASRLSNPSSPVAWAIDGTANLIITAIKAVVGFGQPPSG